MLRGTPDSIRGLTPLFQWAPTLGGECYEQLNSQIYGLTKLFQWAPTLGGECYELAWLYLSPFTFRFQWAPTLGGECYIRHGDPIVDTNCMRFNGHPPLGVNATISKL